MKGRIIIEKDFLKKKLLRKFNDVQKGSFEILLLLCAFSDDDKEVTIAGEILQSCSGFSVSKVHSCVLALEKLGFVERKNKEQRGQENTYLLLLKEFK